MKYIAFNCVLVLFYFISTINQIQCTCVLESDFGFTVNCAFKKSGLFRVRNLGGVKAHFGLGFSVGDDLGLQESLGNLEASKRRALNLRTNVNNIGVLPASKMPVSAPGMIQQSRPNALVARSPLQMKMPSTTVMRPSMNSRPFSKPQSPGIALMTKATSLPLGVPAFRPIPPAEDRFKGDAAMQNTFNKKITMAAQQQRFPINNSIGNSSMLNSRPLRYVTNSAPKVVYSNVQKVPAFHAMPNSVSRISTGPIVQLDNNIPDPTIRNSIISPNSMETQRIRSSVQSNPPTIDLQGHTVEELAAAANVSVEVIQEAIKMREQEMMKERIQQEFDQAAMIQQHLMASQQQTSIATMPTTSQFVPLPTTTPIPTYKAKKHNIAGGHKVMNAPKEYYPVGYDKNFDDNFVSKVDLPATTFHCGDQKHFPGLYGDEDLGCMVFHVCALTDDGLIMKSFLCPESTLFDQTVLKCNWWFYVDCKNSKTLYDSNLPVSKSYQLMKALSFFSSYKSNQNEKDNGVDVEAIKNSVVSVNNKTDKTE